MSKKCAPLLNRARSRRKGGFLAGFFCGRTTEFSPTLPATEGLARPKKPCYLQPSADFLLAALLRVGIGNWAKDACLGERRAAIAFRLSRYTYFAALAKATELFIRLGTSGQLGGGWGLGSAEKEAQYLAAQQVAQPTIGDLGAGSFFLGARVLTVSIAVTDNELSKRVM